MRMTTRWPTLGSNNGERLRQAAWVARCVGRAQDSPLRQRDIEDLSRYLDERALQRGQPLYHVGTFPGSVCIVRHGCIELVVPGPFRRVVIQALRPGDVDGDIQLLLGMPTLYEARASMPSLCLLLSAEAFERLLADHPPLARRWLSGVASRLARSQARVTMLLGLPLRAQVAQLLLEENYEGVVPFPQATLAAMLGARRPSVNRVLKELRDQHAVELEYGRVVIRDVEALRRAATG
jgi:CRP-like cAMP-binding protein